MLAAAFLLTTLLPGSVLFILGIRWTFELANGIGFHFWNDSFSVKLFADAPSLSFARQ